MASRRASEKLILDGHVSVNGRIVVLLGSKVSPERDLISVDGKPVRASRRSVEWCLQGVDRCWSQKERFFTEPELTQARADYEHARQTYRRILGETEAE